MPSILSLQLDAFPLVLVPRAARGGRGRPAGCCGPATSSIAIVCSACRQHVRLRRVHDHDAACGWRRRRRCCRAPIPARPTTTSSSPASSTSAVTWVALRITSADAPAHGVEQLGGRQPELHVDLEPGARHRLEPALGELLGDQHALHQSRVARCAGLGTARRHVHRTYRVPRNLAMRSTPSTMASSPSAKRQPRVAGRAERLARHDRDLRFFEQQLAQLERRRRRATGELATEHALERREAVERALRLEAGDTRDRRQHLVHDPAPTVERGRASRRPRRGRRSPPRARRAATRWRRSRSGATAG